MAKEQGTVARLETGYGFIQRSGKRDLHFLFRNYPRGQQPAVGDVLEFEDHVDATQPAGRQNTAINIAIVTKAPAAANSAASGFTVAFLCGEAIKNDNFFEMEVRVKVTTPDGNPIRGAEARLSADRQPIENPVANPTTPSNGEAVFLIAFYKSADWNPQDLRRISLVATVKVGDKEAVFAEVWPKQEIKDSATQTAKDTTASAAPNGTVERLKVLNADSKGVIWCEGFKGTIHFASFDAGGKKKSQTVSATADWKVDFSIGQVVLGKKTAACSFESQADGNTPLAVDFLDCMQREVVIKLSVVGMSKPVSATLKYKQC